MATLKQRLHRKNSSGTYDTIHYETSSDVVMRPSGRSVEQDLAAYLPEVQNNDNVPESLKSSKLVVGATKAFLLGKDISFSDHTHTQYAASSHNHSASNITSGTLPIARGGTGRSTLTSGYFLRGNGTDAITMSSVDEVKELFGIDGFSQAEFKMEILFDTGVLYNPEEEIVVDLNTSVSVGSVVIFDEKLWRVVHKSGTVAYLASLYWVQDTKFDSGGDTEYAGSDLASVAMSFQNSMSESALAQCNNTTVNGVTAKVFVCSYEQANGEFSYFDSDSRRILHNTSGDSKSWWTSSPYSSRTISRISPGGNLNPYGGSDPEGLYGFRPFVALRL